MPLCSFRDVQKTLESLPHEFPDTNQMYQSIAQYTLTIFRKHKFNKIYGQLKHDAENSSQHILV